MWEHPTYAGRLYICPYHWGLIINFFPLLYIGLVLGTFAASGGDNHE